MRQRPFYKVTAALVGGIALRGFAVFAADNLLIPPPARMAHLAYSATANGKLLSSAPASDAALFAGRLPSMPDGGARERSIPQIFFSRPMSYLDKPSNPMPEPAQAATYGNKLADLPVWGGRFSLELRHGAEAKLRFDDSPTRPTIEFGANGPHKLKMAIAFHW
jgi:hypothetical protein